MNNDTKASEAIQALKNAKDELLDIRYRFALEIIKSFGALDELVSKDFTCNFPVYHKEYGSPVVALHIVHDEFSDSVQFILPGQEDHMDLLDRANIFKILDDRVSPAVLLEALDLFEYYAVKDLDAQILDLEINIAELKEAHKKLSS